MDIEILLKDSTGTPQKLAKSMPDYCKRKVMYVGCNMIDYTPISYARVKQIMGKKDTIKVDRHG